MTDEQREELIRMKQSGESNRIISETLGISENTIKTFVRRNNIHALQKKEPVVIIPKEHEHVCKECGIPVAQYQCRKAKLFCSDKCRMAWWNRNQDQVNRKANYSYECAYCKKEFVAYGNSHRKYCCHECYVSDRFGGE